MPELEGLWDTTERRTLRLGPVWVLSALTGRSRFDEDEQRAFWDGVTSAALSTGTLGRSVMSDAAAHRRSIFDEFAADGRPVVSGLLAVTQLLARVAPESRDEVRRAYLGVGRSFALARGPFGRRMSLQDERSLVLVAQLLQTSAETVGDNPLNSALPI